MSDAECWCEFRFYRNDINRLQETFHIPDGISTYNRLSVDGIEALCLMLKRFTYPCRLCDLVPRVPVLFV